MNVPERYVKICKMQLSSCRNHTRSTHEGVIHKGLRTQEQTKEIFWHASGSTNKACAAVGRLQWKLTFQRRRAANGWEGPARVGDSSGGRINLVFEREWNRPLLCRWFAAAAREVDGFGSTSCLCLRRRGGAAKSLSSSSDCTEACGPTLVAALCCSAALLPHPPQEKVPHNMHAHTHTRARTHNNRQYN